MPVQLESLTIIDEFREEQHAIAQHAAAQVHRLFLLNVPTGGDSPTLDRDRVVLFAQNAASVVAGAQIAAVRSADQFIARYTTSELRTPVAPVGLDPHEFTGPHLTDDPDMTLEVVLAARPTRVTLGV